MNAEDKNRVERKVDELVERVEDLENERETIKHLPHAFAKLAGTVDTLKDLIIERFDRVDGGVEKATSLKTAIQFAAVLLLPILLALIGGYFTLKAGSP